jgi:hypothetical protein
VNAGQSAGDDSNLTRSRTDSSAVTRDLHESTDCVLRAVYFQEDGIPLRGRNDGVWAGVGDFRAIDCAKIISTFDRLVEYRFEHRSLASIWSGVRRLLEQRVHFFDDENGIRRHALDVKLLCCVNIGMAQQ